MGLMVSEGSWNSLQTDSLTESVMELITWVAFATNYNKLKISKDKLNNNK